MYDILMMFGTEKQITERAAFRKEHELGLAKSSGLVDWKTVRGWPKNLYIDAKTWDENHLAGKLRKPIVFKSGTKIYERPLPANTPMGLKMGHSEWVGFTAFNADIVVPVLEMNGQTMMGITPFELLSQRTGVSRAKGHTVIAGLGLGWSLSKIHARHSVHEITVIEQDRDVLDRVRKLMGLNDTIPKKINWICGDMWAVAPKLKADFLFADIWPGYGDVRWEYDRLVKECPDIKTVWCWGTGGTRGSTR